MRDTNQLNGNHSKRASKNKKAPSAAKGLSCKDRLKLCVNGCKSEKAKKMEQMKHSLRGIGIDTAKLP